MRFQKGDDVLICTTERITSGRIEMISRDEVSAILVFDGMVMGHVGMMPVMRHDKAHSVYRSIIDGTSVILRHTAAKQEGEDSGERT